MIAGWRNLDKVVPEQGQSSKSSTRVPLLLHNVCYLLGVQCKRRLQKVNSPADPAVRRDAIVQRRRVRWMRTPRLSGFPLTAASTPIQDAWDVRRTATLMTERACRLAGLISRNIRQLWSRKPPPTAWGSQDRACRQRALMRRELGARMRCGHEGPARGAHFVCIDRRLIDSSALFNLQD